MHRPLTIPLWGAIVIAAFILLLCVIIWSAKRRRRPRLDFERGEGGIDQLLPSIVGLTHGTLVEGNRIELLQNGEFFHGLFHDLEAAEKTIDFETFLCKSGELTRQLVDVLSKKARAGVDVRFLADARGGRKMKREEKKSMAAAGVHVAHYHPIRISNLGRLNNRDHRKLVVIDGRIGYAGGHCLVDSWLGNAEDREHFRDMSVRVQGPVVAQLQAAFSENWIEETGDVTAGRDFFRDLGRAGEAKAFVAYVTTHGSPSSVELLHYLAIRAAEKRIWIQNPYFLPSTDARAALAEAVARGVDVRIMLPSADATDAPIVQHASHHHFGTLLKSGVRIFEFRRTLLHQKVMVVDSVFSAVGSTNFDTRSFQLNDEVSLAVVDRDLASQLESVFDDDAKSATEVELKEWSRRPWHHKLLDGALFLFSEEL